MNWEEFKEKVKLILINFEEYYKISYESDRITFYVDEYEFIYTKADYERFQSSISNYNYKNFILNKEEKYEVVIYELKDNGYGLGVFDYQGRVYNSDESISLKVSDISDEMLYFLIKQIDMDKYFKAFNLKYIDDYHLNNFNLWKLLKLALNNVKSIVVNYQDSMNEEDVVNLINSYFFEISLENSELYRIACTSENVFGKETCFDTVDTMSMINKFPKRVFNQELLDQYNVATMANDPMLQFIGYYHVLEYFYKRTVLDDAYNYLKEKLCTSNTYNLSEKDLQLICEMINKKYNKLLRISERDALGLTLKKYITIDDLKKRIDSDYLFDFDENNNYLICEIAYSVYPRNYFYYKDNVVTFSEGAKVDLESIDKNEIYENLKNRIYDTRNAIVHSKASAEIDIVDGYYNPFEDAKDLRKEIPLMKAIAEQIIIKTAEEI